MKFNCLFLCLCFMSLISVAQNDTDQIAIIPQPVKVVKNAGHFLLPQKIVIASPALPEMKEVVAFLSDRLSTPTGIPVALENSNANATVQLILNKKEDNIIGKEGYNLSVTPGNIIIKANDPAGLFYGVQTLDTIISKRNRK